MNLQIHELAGLAGAFLILLAYFLLQTDRIRKEGLAYSVINLAGALLLSYSLVYDWNLGAVVIELFWILISLYGIYRYWRRRSF